MTPVFLIVNQNSLDQAFGTELVHEFRECAGSIPVEGIEIEAFTQSEVSPYDPSTSTVLADGMEELSIRVQRMMEQESRFPLALQIGLRCHPGLKEILPITLLPYAKRLHDVLISRGETTGDGGLFTRYNMGVVMVQTIMMRSPQDVWNRMFRNNGESIMN